MFLSQLADLGESWELSTAEEQLLGLQGTLAYSAPEIVGKILPWKLPVVKLEVVSGFRFVSISPGSVELNIRGQMSRRSSGRVL